MLNEQILRSTQAGTRRQARNSQGHEAPANPKYHVVDMDDDSNTKTGIDPIPVTMQGEAEGTGTADTGLDVASWELEASGMQSTCWWTAC